MYSRPLLSRTQSYLYPYIKYNYGHDLATIFHKIRPFDSRILLKDESAEVSFDNLKGIICLFESADDLDLLEKHPCFIEYNQTFSYPSVIFKFENEHAFNNFILGRYSEMYPTFLKDKKDYFVYEHMGISVVSLIYEVCTRSYNRRSMVAAELKIKPDQLQELDSKPNFSEEILLLTSNHYSKWENLSSPSSNSSGYITSLFRKMNEISQESMDLLP